MTPYIILVDIASVSSTFGNRESAEPKARMSMAKKPETTTIEDFLSSVGFALAEPRSKIDGRHSNSLLNTARDRYHQNREAPGLTQPRIGSATSHNDYRIQPRGNNVNRFEITRNGVFVAVVLLGRPTFRLGESISVIVDFQQSSIHCHSLTATLESFEIIDPTIALRSQASIYRATRRIHASCFELTLFQKRATFNPTAPLNATPNFHTSSVSLVWGLRFEFIIREKTVNGMKEHVIEAVKDEKESVSIDTQVLPCEKFEVSVPLNISGNISNFHFKKTKNVFSI